MGLAILHSRAQIGIDAPAVTIEVFLSGGLPTFNIVGLAETAVRESKDRVRGAILSSNFVFPQERITVNLGPADMKKTGGRFDLSIGIGILAASRQIPSDALQDYEFYGELGLDGSLRSIPGVLPAAVKAAQNGRPIFVPQNNVEEAALAGGAVIAAESLLNVTAMLNGSQEPVLFTAKTTAERSQVRQPDLCEVKGQAFAKRALEIAAAGGHNLLFIGPPGTGKSMLAQRMPSLLPELEVGQAIEVASINSVLGLPMNTSRRYSRPFRAPHHTASAVALVGGGSEPRPGEISRAHHGVLFLDELPEFSRSVLEVLREPMERGYITISRANRQTDFPASFQLIAAMNPCPCGYLGDKQSSCRCSGESVRRYRGKISGPLLDRIDIHVEVNRPSVAMLRPDAPSGETSAVAARRVAIARRQQTSRNGSTNATLTGDELGPYFAANSESLTLLENAANAIPLSARAYQRVQRVSRTIADLAGAVDVQATHVAEALNLRRLDRIQGPP